MPLIIGELIANIEVMLPAPEPEGGQGRDARFAAAEQERMRSVADLRLVRERRVNQSTLLDEED